MENKLEKLEMLLLQVFSLVLIFHNLINIYKIDHGCDAFTSGFQALVFAKAFQLGNNEYLLFICLAISAGFYFIILEEYYLGSFVLGYLNPVTDGSILIIGMFLFLGIFGIETFKTNFDI